MGHVAKQFENLWLPQYPRSNQCVHEKGGEFVGWKFINLLARYGIKDVCKAVRNPQPNTI